MVLYSNGRALMNTSVGGYYIGRDGLTFTGILGSNVLVNNGLKAIKQWVKVYDEWYYGDVNGHILKNQWLGNYYLMGMDVWQPTDGSITIM